MDAITMLESDHKAAKKVMDEINTALGGEKKSLFDALKRELLAHDLIEEGIFYPALQAHPGLTAFGSKDKSAHEEVEAALKRLAELPMANPDWAPSFKAMQQKLLAHVADEEGSLFPKVRAALSQAELNELGGRIKNRKEELLKTVVPS